MDCEKFDESVMDALYGELDELTLAALRRHVESCSRCAPIYANLRAAREVASLPLEDPPDDFEERVLAAERAAQRMAPWHKKLVRAAAWAGSHAMRPQLAMAALFMFVIGSSVLLLRAKPGTFGPVSVSERGAPAAEEAAQPQAAAPAATAGARGGAAEKSRAAAADKSEAAPGAAEAKQTEDGAVRADNAPAAPAPAAPAASAAAEPAEALSLEEALKLKEREGCAAAAAKLQTIASTDGKDGDEAKRQLEACQKDSAKGGSAKPPPAAAPSNR